MYVTRNIPRNLMPPPPIGHWGSQFPYRWSPKRPLSNAEGNADKTPGHCGSTNLDPSQQFFHHLLPVILNGFQCGELKGGADENGGGGIFVMGPTKITYRVSALQTYQTICTNAMKGKLTGSPIFLSFLFFSPILSHCQTELHFAKQYPWIQ